MLRTPLRFISLLVSILVIGCGMSPERPEERPSRASPPSPTQPPPRGRFEGERGSLLDARAGKSWRAPEVRWSLPADAATVVDALLIAVANDDRSALAVLLSDDARWGTPDRRELHAVSIRGSEDAFLDALRAAASRFREAATIVCPEVPPALAYYVQSGSEPLWCFVLSQDALDALTFRLTVVGGGVRVGYVGLFEGRPVAPLAWCSGPDAPPRAPQPRAAADGPVSGDRLPAARSGSWLVDMLEDVATTCVISMGDLCPAECSDCYRMQGPAIGDDDGRSGGAPGLCGTGGTVVGEGHSNDWGLCCENARTDATTKCTNSYCWGCFSYSPCYKQSWDPETGIYECIVYGTRCGPC